MNLSVELNADPFYLSDRLCERKNAKKSTYMILVLYSLLQNALVMTRLNVCISICRNKVRFIVC